MEWVHTAELPVISGLEWNVTEVPRWVRSMSFSETKCNADFLSVTWKRRKTFKIYFFSSFYLSAHTAVKVFPPLCSCKPALSDLILNVTSGFSSFQIWNSLTFYCGPLALCLAHFHWKPNSVTQQIHRHTLFCYCLKEQLVVSYRFHSHIFKPAKHILLKCLDSVCTESSLEGGWCNSTKVLSKCIFCIISNWYYKEYSCCKSQLKLWCQILLQLSLR